MTTERTELCQAIITQVFEVCPSAKVFGGYVLDMLTGDEPNDIDFLIPCDPTSVLQKCTESFERIVLRSISKDYGSSTIWRVEVWNGMCHVDVDLVMGNGHSHLPDADVKRLTLDFLGRVSLMRYDSIPLSLLQRIQKKQYVAEVGMSQERHDKVRAKGWTEVQLP
jgi:hypothetical protein